VRACFSGDPRKYNFEVKCLDGTANPYFAVASILAAGMLGVKASSPLKTQACLGISLQLSVNGSRSKYNDRRRTGSRWYYENSSTIASTGIRISRRRQGIGAGTWRDLCYVLLPCKEGLPLDEMY
jgi:Glutamine synthetase, catalytic domain